MIDLFRLILFLARSKESGQGYRGMLALSVAASVVAGAISTALLGLINAVLNTPEPRPARLLLSFGALCAALPAFRLLASALLIRLAQRSRVQLEVQLSRSILKAPLRRLEEIGAPRLQAVLTEDVETIIFSLGNIPVLLMHLSFLVAAIGYLGWLSLQVLLLLLVLMALGITTYLLPMRVAQRHGQQSRNLSDEIFRHFRGLTEGIKELKIHRGRRRAFMDRKLAVTANDRARHRIAAATSFAVAASWGQLLFFLAIGVLLFGLPRLQTIDAATLTGYTLIILYLLGPLEVVLNQLPNLNAAAIALRQIQSLGLSLEQGSDPADEEKEASASWRSLELVGIRHDYRSDSDERTFTLGPIDLSLRPGECLFLVGGNGSGKTTLTKLLMGLYVPEDGRILLDGEEVTDSNRERLRSRFSAVFSDFYLFESLLGLEGTELALQARGYLEKLQLDRKVQIHEGTLSTVQLSQGQRKRLALLTAYLEDRSIYVFDEWAADQDPMFREIFYLQILPGLKARGKTAIVISHDDRYYHVADRVIKLDAGRIETEWEPLGEARNATL
ncbi:MAG TPA: cyclic peptide export ABC transporter [Thermoanaerobaculia bacterium]|nr:cyclic peptide export ABC transporter [Thermoanaerobaculia bacterium]